MKLFTGNANVPLAKKVAENMGISLGQAVVGSFSDGEILVEIVESIRGQDVFIIQPTSAPTDHNLMELVMMADAMRRSSAASITAVVPYFGYARQDRRVRSARVPIGAKVVADIMEASGINRLITIDLHADQIQGFFYIPVDNVFGIPVICEDIKIQNFKNIKDIVVVSPDVGGVVRARALAKRLEGSDFAIIDKRRPKYNQSEVMHIIGDVEDRDCIIIDDIIDTAGTICQATKALKNKGARSITAYGTHPILSGNAIDNIEQSGLREIVVTDTIPLSEAAIKCTKIRQVSISSVLAETISRVNSKGSVSSLFLD